MKKKCWMAWLAVLMMAWTAVGAAEETVYELPIDLSGGMPYSADTRTNPDVYEDPTIRVERHRVDQSEYGCIYFYALVTIKHPSQLRTVSGDPNNFIRGKTAPVYAMARRVNAVLAFNGDYVTSYQGDEGSKYCLRQGVVYRETVVPYLDMLLIDEDGDFHIYKAGEELEQNKTEIGGKKIINAFQFGPALVIGGEPVDDAYVTDPGHSPIYSHPDNHTARMCIAQLGPLQYMVLTTWDGVNTAQLRDLAMSLADCKTVYVLDGGNSAQLVYLKAQINKNSHNQRNIPDAIYFASAYPDN